MPRLRWKWILYHVYGSVLTAAIVLLAGGLFLPNDKLAVFDLATVVKVVLFGLAGSALLGTVFGFNFSTGLTNLLDEVAIGAKNLAYGNLTYRLNFTHDRDIGDIARAFNDMANRLEMQVAALQKLAEENERLIQQTKTTAINEERQRLARELHDAVSQQLFAISLTAATAARALKKDPDKCAPLIDNIEQSAAKAQAEMRALLLQLRPLNLEGERLVEAIAALADELQEKQNLQFELQLDETLQLPTNIENQLYRIAQEGLSNVLRHAQASKVAIRLQASANGRQIQLSIEDDGQGFVINDAAKTSYGIKSIKERAAHTGGTVEWITYPGKGTNLRVRIPLAHGDYQEERERDGA